MGSGHRFQSIWGQVAETFSNHSSNLVFEIFNEPHLMTVDNLNTMNAQASPPPLQDPGSLQLPPPTPRVLLIRRTLRTGCQVLPIIRKTNPSRVVFFGGLQYMNPTWITSNPTAMALPSDPWVAVEIHNYDPYTYAGPNPTMKSWGTPADVATLQAWVNATQTWASASNISIYYGEFGTTSAQSAATGRLSWYKEHVHAAQAAGFAISVWDDDGMFAILNRTTKIWNEDVLEAMGLSSPPSPPPGPPAPPSPPPSCPGGSLKACIALCPATPQPVCKCPISCFDARSSCRNTNCARSSATSYLAVRLGSARCLGGSLSHTPLDLGFVRRYVQFGQHEVACFCGGFLSVFPHCLMINFASVACSTARCYWVSLDDCVNECLKRC
jgi:hypothetical protein